MRALREFGLGAAAVGRAAGLLLREPRLRRLAAWPTLLSGLLLVALLYLSLRYGGAIVDRFWPSLAGGGHAVARLLVTGLLIVLSGAVFFFGSTLIADPFIDLLSAATETIAGRQLPETPFSLIGVGRELLLVLRDVALDLTLFVVLQGSLLLLHLVPVVGAAAQVGLGWLVNAALVALEMCASPLARRQIRGLARYRYFRRHAPRLVGLGAAAVLVLLAPLAQLLTLPLAVIGGTLVVLGLDPPAEAPA